MEMVEMEMVEMEMVLVVWCFAPYLQLELELLTQV